MLPGAGGATTDPDRLREAAGLVRARADDVTDVSGPTRDLIAAAAAACGGPLTSAALAAFEHELNGRASDCAEALYAAGHLLAQTAADAEAGDRFPVVPLASGSISEALG